MLLLNCTESNEDEVQECTLLGSPLYYEIGFYIMLGVAVVGSVLNLFALSIFTFSENMTTRFLRYLKYYLVNSLITTINYMIMLALAVSLNDSVFGSQYKMYSPNLFSSYKWLFHYSYIFMPIWSVSYTFGSLIDIAIAYERILMYLTRVKFLRDTNLYVSLLTMLAISFFINLPANLSIDIYETTLNFSAANLTTKVFWHDRRIFPYNNLFTIFLYSTTFIRDILTMVVEIAITILLIISIVNFFKKKERVVNIKEQKSASEAVVFRKTGYNNSKISLYICIISCLNHIGSFIALITLLFISTSLNLIILTANGYLLLIRHSLDFFLLLRLNAKFRMNVILALNVILPDCIKIKSKKQWKKVTSAVTSSTLATKRNDGSLSKEQATGPNNMFAIASLHEPVAARVSSKFE